MDSEEYKELTDKVCENCIYKTISNKKCKLFSNKNNNFISDNICSAKRTREESETLEKEIKKYASEVAK